MNKLFFCVFASLALSLSPAESVFAKNSLLIEPGRNVKLSYVVKSGKEIVDRSEKKEPLEFEFGKDALSPSFKKNIAGMKAGEKKKFHVTPEEAFGPWNLENTRIIKRSELPVKKLKPGTILTATHPYKSEALTGRVRKIAGDYVELDFNHPLAGKTLQVEVKIIEVS